MKLEFPKNFYWGSATSAHQVEWNNYNDWSEWEKSEKRINFLRSQGLIEKYGLENYISGRAADHYNRFQDDFKIAKELGHNATRFSIEWSRIEPEEGRFNEKEIEHYRQVILALKERGIEPFVTLWHWTNPIWIRDIGGWENKKTIEYFLEYVAIVVESIKDINFWMPFNEPQSYVGMSYVAGNFPPQVKSLYRANKVFKNLMTAHKKVYKLIHKELNEKVKVGTSEYLVYHTPYKNTLLNILVVRILNYIRGVRFVNKLRDYRDFIGLQYYHHDRIRPALGGRLKIAEIDNENKEITDMGWEIYPEGIYHVLKDLKKYNKPIYITENGLADAKDEKREKFIKEHLKWAHQAISEGIDVRGYFYWSLLDNFEWDKGFWSRFGLVEIDYRTMERKIRNSAWKYKKIIENGLEIYNDIANHY